MSSLLVIMLTVLVRTFCEISIYRYFCKKKMCVAFAFAKATHIFFSKSICIFAILNDQSFNNRLTNDIVSFEQLGQLDLMINPQWLKLTMSRTNFHGPKDVAPLKFDYAKVQI